MKNFIYLLGSHIALLSIVILSIFTVGKGLRLTLLDTSVSLNGGEGSSRGDRNYMIPKEGANKEELGMEMYPTGSSLPDCAHACGPCFPCKRVMVSFRCAATESCPVVYRCKCNGRYYHVPSN